MKLYARVESERAAKAQGGEYINVTIHDERRAELARITVSEGPDGYVLAYDYDEDSTIAERVRELELIKGEKQKSESRASGA